MCDLHPPILASAPAEPPRSLDWLAHPVTPPTHGPAIRGTAKNAAAARPTRRLRLWELPTKYHCPVIGTCLTVAELRALARKVGGAALGPLTDYQVHVSFVAAAGERNALSLAAHKALERKYAATVRRFAGAAGPAALLDLWQQALDRGEVPAAFWALLTHARADETLRARGYEDVHMLSHQIGAGLAADLKALTEARRALAEERRERAQAATRAAGRQAEQAAEIASLRARVATLAGLELALASAQARVAEFESGSRFRTLADRVAELEAALTECLQRGTAQEQQNATLRAERDALRADRAALAERLATQEAAAALLESVLLADDDAEDDAEDCCGKRDCAGCPCHRDGAGAVDLRGRRILCVGGRNALVPRWRALVTRCNGELVRHDGGLEDSRARLHALLASADAVVCPLDQISHDACLRAKRYCKQAGKPCVLLSRSGLSDFAHALAQVVADPPGGPLTAASSSGRTVQQTP